MTYAYLSTPVYLDPAQGPHCGSCRLCEIENPYNPCNFGHCGHHDTQVNIRRKTDCEAYIPKELPHILNLEAQ